MPKGVRKPVFGVGINDYPGTSSWMIDGVRFKCPLYRKWVSMLARCYKKEYLEIFPTYIGCSVSEEWKYFSNFRSWMEMQDWEGKEYEQNLDNQAYYHIHLSKDEYYYLSCILGHLVPAGKISKSLLDKVSLDELDCEDFDLVEFSGQPRESYQFKIKENK